jgi:hypothetical protein
LAALSGKTALAHPSGCVVDGLQAPYQRQIGDQVVYVRKFAAMFDAAMDDFGGSAFGDRLWFYCVTHSPTVLRGEIAICLSGERCPWR